MAEQTLHQPAFIPYSPTPAVRKASSGSGVVNYAVSMIASIMTVGIFFSLAPGCRDPFVFPLIICGTLAGADVIAWLRGRLDTFDPKALIAIMMTYNMFVAPLLQQAWDAHTEEWDRQVYDWARYFGVYGWMNVAALICYKVGQRFMFRRAAPVKTYWSVSDGRFTPALICMLAISLMAAVVVQKMFGGLRAEEREHLMALGSGLQHLSWLLMLSDPFPVLLAMAAVRMLADPRRKTSMFTIALLLGALAVAAFLFLGLRGSRSAVMYLLFMGAGMAHYRLRHIPVTYAVGAGVVLLIFIYYYGFFKKMGAAGFQALQSTEQRLYLERRTGHTVVSTMLGDLSRAEMQAFMIYRLMEHGDRYKLRWGTTYLRSAIMIIPRAIWYKKPPGIGEAGTDLQYGEGTARDPKRISTRVYALAGEALLNFGFPGVPVMFLLYGAGLGWYRRKLGSWQWGDSRFFLAPTFALVVIVGFFGDSDNLMFSLLKNGTLPIIIILLGSVRTPIAGRAAK